MHGQGLLKTTAAGRHQVTANRGCPAWLLHPGARVEEAIARAKVAISDHIAALVEMRQPVPVEGDASAASIATVAIERDAA